MARSLLPANAGPRSRRARALLLGALIAAAAACGTRTSYPGQNPFEGDVGAPQIRILVRNANFYDATLTAIMDSGRRRLGTVGGNTSAVFSVPWTAAGGLRIQIDLLAGPSCTTDFIGVSQGDDVMLEIASDLDNMPGCR